MNPMRSTRDSSRSTTGLQSPTACAHIGPSPRSPKRSARAPRPSTGRSPATANPTGPTTPTTPTTRPTSPAGGTDPPNSPPTMNYAPRSPRNSPPAGPPHKSPAILFPPSQTGANACAPKASTRPSTKDCSRGDQPNYAPAGTPANPAADAVNAHTAARYPAASPSGNDRRRPTHAPNPATGKETSSSAGTAPHRSAPSSTATPDTYD